MNFENQNIYLSELGLDKYTEQVGDYYATMRAINVNEDKKQKNHLDYLPWADAWDIAKKICPVLERTVYENNQGMPYHNDGKTAWVKVGITMFGIEYIEYLAVMDNRNNAIPLDKIESTVVVKAIQRATVKAIARHGLAIYIYKGEDLPDDIEDENPKSSETTKKVAKSAPMNQARKPVPMNQARKPASKPGCISVPQRQRLFAIAKRIHGESAKDIILAVISAKGYTGTDNIKVSDYDEIITMIENANQAA